MLAGLNNQNGGGSTCESYWRQLSVGYKYLIILAFFLGIFGIFTSFLTYIFADLIVFTINKLQIWRLITSFLVDISILSVLMKLYMLSFSLPLVEKTYSTSFVILEVLVQTVISNIFFIVIGEILALIGLVKIEMLVSYGLVHLVFIFLWEKVAMSPEQMTKFCFFPCLMPLKYLPWCFLAFFVLFGADVYAITSCLVGFLQFMVLKRSAIQLPMSFYRKLENLLPKSMKESPGFASIASTEASLRSICRQTSSSRAGEPNHPFNVNNEAVNDRVEVIGKGVSIGSSSPVQETVPKNYKNHWIQDGDDAQKQKSKQEGLLEEKKPQQEQDEKTGGKLLMDVNESMMSDYPLSEGQITRSQQEKNRN